MSVDDGGGVRGFGVSDRLRLTTVRLGLWAVVDSLGHGLRLGLRDDASRLVINGLGLTHILSLSVHGGGVTLLSVDWLTLSVLDGAGLVNHPSPTATTTPTPGTTSVLTSALTVHGGHPYAQDHQGQGQTQDLG